MGFWPKGIAMAHGNRMRCTLVLCYLFLLFGIRGCWVNIEILLYLLGSYAFPEALPKTSLLDEAGYQA